jgi:MSHA biogenesis protein MshM
MYHDHFGLTQPPFRITPDTDVFFTGGNRGAILEALLYAIVRGEGIVKVTGEVGSGKTMLCSMLQRRLPAHVESVYLANPSVGPDEVLHAIAFELGLEPAAGSERLATLHMLHDYLLERHSEGKRVVAFIEESQSIPLGTLEQIRLLSNLETRTDKLLQIVLFGQPELDENLRKPEIRQLRDRIAHSFRLGPLAVDEVGEYLLFRLRAAGYRGPPLFPRAAVRRIARASGGLTRRINLIADKALLAAYAENTHSITPRHVRIALRESEFSGRVTSGTALPRPAYMGLAMAASALLGAGLYAMLEQPGPESAAAALMAVAPPPGSSGLDEGVRNALLSIGSTAAVSAAGEQGDALTHPPAGAGASIGEAEGSLIHERLNATYRWLALAAPATYSIQLLGAADDEQLGEQLRAVVRLLGTEHLFVYRTIAAGRPSFTVLYGAFADRAAAQDALAALPPPLQAYRPILRTVQGVRSELRQQQPAT